MIRRLVMILALGGCTSGSDRARAVAEWQASRDSVLSGSVVEALKTPTAPTRIIYDRPTDLSYDSMRVKRPDMVGAADRPRR